MQTSNIVVILSQKVSKILEHLDSFQYFPMHLEGAAEGKCQSNHRIALHPSIHP